VWSVREQTAFWFCLFNIFLWLFAQVPQLVENYRQQRAESLSFGFLCTWLIGDITNLLGCILTPQLRIQLYTAIYFLFMDGVVLSQWTYYHCKNKNKTDFQKLESNDLPQEVWIDPAPLADEEQLSVNLSSTSSKSVLPGILGLGLVLSTGVLAMHYQTGGDSEFHTGRVLLSHSFGDHECGGNGGGGALWETVLGSICAWVSGLLYFTARFPQIYHNYKRRTTEGLSFFLFFSATCANVCYSISILLPESTNWGSNSFWESTFAYLLGSGGTVASTVPILYQFFAYRKVGDDGLPYEPLNGLV
jgi:uncharacterized protein with PQ loop repeat